MRASPLFEIARIIFRQGVSIWPWFDKAPYVMPRILSVGQCGMDHFWIGRAIRKILGSEAEVAAAATFPDAIAAIEKDRFDLVLVNRITDRDGSLGVELIKTLKAHATAGSIPVMLVSNYPEAQQEAETLGALPGFGKSNLNTSGVSDRLRRLLISSK